MNLNSSSEWNILERVNSRLRLIFSLKCVSLSCNNWIKIKNERRQALLEIILFQHYIHFQAFIIGLSIVSFSLVLTETTQLQAFSQTLSWSSLTNYTTTDRFSKDLPIFFGLWCWAYWNYTTTAIFTNPLMVFFNQLHNYG